MYRFCDELRRHGFDKIDWACSGRVNNMDVDYARQLRKSGCRQIAYGVESGSQIILDNLNKSTKVEGASRAVWAAHEGGLEVFGSFMVGCPGENQETLEKTRRFILDNPLSYIAVCHFTPMPGTEYWDMETYKQFGDLISKDFSIFNVFSGIPLVPFGLTSDNLIDWRKKTYREFYLRPSRLSREIRHITNIRSWKYATKLAAGLLADAPLSVIRKLYPIH